jgi:hypothetical protein
MQLTTSKEGLFLGEAAGRGPGSSEQGLFFFRDRRVTPQPGPEGARPVVTVSEMGREASGETEERRKMGPRIEGLLRAELWLSCHPEECQGQRRGGTVGLCQAEELRVGLCSAPCVEGEGMAYK